MHAFAVIYTKEFYQKKREIILRSYKETDVVNGVLQLEFGKTEFSLGVRFLSVVHNKLHRAEGFVHTAGSLSYLVP
jgi:hypothetical protein